VIEKLITKVALIDSTLHIRGVYFSVKLSWVSRGHSLTKKTRRSRWYNIEFYINTFWKKYYCLLFQYPYLQKWKSICYNFFI